MLRDRVKEFKAGNIKNCYKAWKRLTSDRNILDVVQHGLKLNFQDEPPEKAAFEYPRPEVEYHTIEEEIGKLLKKGVISASSTGEEGEYFSNLFVRPKKDGTYRTILNLKFLNKECETEHFKMESLKQALHMVKPFSYLASIDIKDAFYSVPIHKSHKKYLKFLWNSSPLEFDAMPNGYKDAMRMFTKLLKPVFSHLRELGYDFVIYVDDSLLHGEHFEECLENVKVTIECLQELGFVIHAEKSCFIPTQILVFLGFIINTRNMTLTLTNEKKESIKNKAIAVLNKDIVSIRTVASLIGNMTSCFEAVPFGRLYYRHIEMSKIEALKRSKYAKEEIQWWIDNIDSSFAYIKSVPEIDHEIFTDASNEGWGAHNACNTDINGRWSVQEQEWHINILEMIAVKFALLSYLPLSQGINHIRVMSDNTTAISYINRQGGTHNMHLNDLAVEAWELCKNYNVHISAAHIPGKHNILADSASREFIDAAEWMLSPEIFDNITQEYGLPDIDLFASRLNRQIPTYASWKPDPESTYIDAMSISWTGKFVYIFPPFSMLWPVITKLEQDKVEEAIIIAPRWPTQSWYPRLKRIARYTRHISSQELILPGTNKHHPMAPKMTLMAIKVERCRRQQKV